MSCSNGSVISELGAAREMLLIMMTRKLRGIFFLGSATNGEVIIYGGQHYIRSAFVGRAITHGIATMRNQHFMGVN